MTLEQTRSESALKQQSRNSLPLVKSERIWNFRRFTWVNVSMAIATWAFLQGGAVALYVGAEAAIASTVIGYGIGCLLVAFAPCIPTARYGTEQFTLLRSVLGSVGSRIVGFVLVIALIAAWVGLLGIMFGRASANIAIEFVPALADRSVMLIAVFSLLAVLIAWFILIRGARAVGKVQAIISPVIAILTVVLLVMVFTRVSWVDLTAIEPLLPMEDRHLAFMLAVELNVAGGFAWWPVFGNLSRMTDTPRAAFWPNMIGMFFASVVAAVVGAFSALALGSDDPTVWMIPLGGAFLGVFALGFIAFANITTMVSEAYSGVSAVMSGTTKRIAKMPWPVVSALFMIPVIAIVLLPELVYDNYGRFLSWGAIIVAPMCGIMIVDFYLLRRQRLSLADLYTTSKTSRYRFWGGFNWVALIAAAAGAMTYAMLLHPVTYEPAGAFGLLGASIPAAVVGGVVHYLGTQLVVKPLGLGGYDPKLKNTEVKVNITAQ
ncbi:MAG: purine-cytosine permease family protein [Leucobacter sp.]